MEADAGRDSGVVVMTWLSYSARFTPKRLSITQQPAGATAGVALTTQPVVQILDGGGEFCAAATNTVTATKHSGVTGTLSGTTSKAAVAGTATFTDLAMSAAEGGVSIDFAATGLTGAQSSAFTVASAGGAVTKFFNSTEPGGDGSDANCIFADDFNRGWWYRVDADHVTGGPTPGTTTIGEAGWFGNIFSTPTPAGAIDNSSQMLGLTYCADYGDNNGGVGGLNYAMHEFSAGSGSGTPALYDEIWARWYAKWETGAQFGGEKHTNATVFAGDIAYANIQLNCGTGSAGSTANPSLQKLYPSGQDFCQTPNISAITLQANKTYCFILHLKLSSTSSSNDGLMELYIDDCGVNGLSPPGSPTLRTQRTGINYGRSHPSAQTNPSKIEVLWFERWANPGSDGRAFLGGIYVRKGNNPVGFYGSP